MVKASESRGRCVADRVSSLLRAARTCAPALAIAAALMAGCAGPVTQRVVVDDRARAEEERAQQTLALKSELDLTLRLWNVGYAVLKAGAPDCGDVLRPSLGLYALSIEQFAPQARERAREALGLDSRQRVFAVYPGGAAEKSGMRPGDVIVQSSAGLPAADESRSDALRRMPSGTPVQLALDRSGSVVQINLAPDMVCDYPLQIRDMGIVNAFADGKAIYVTRGMMRFAVEDRELALVIAHELAHNTMGHRDKKVLNASVGLLFDVLGAASGVNTRGAFSDIGARAFSQDFEREADYVGMYYLARAGYPTQGVAQFWRRMAAEHPGSIRTNHAATHPPTPERFLALERVGEEIRRKQADGEELAPRRIQR